MGKVATYRLPPWQSPPLHTGGKKVVPKWARWLHNPYRLGGPYRLGAKDSIGGGPRIGKVAT